MTTQPPPIEFKVRADARQAQQEMDGLNKKFKEGETASAMLDKRIEALTKDLDQLSTAVVSGKGNTEAYRAEMQRLERQLDALHGVTPPTSKAIESLGSSMEQASGKTRNVGQAALEASRAMEDLQYGVGGVVNNIPSLVMSLGGGAGLTAAISLAAVGVNQLVKAFTKVDKGAEEATKAASKHVDDLVERIAGLRSELRKLALGADGFERAERQQAVDTAEQQAKRLSEALGGMERVADLAKRFKSGAEVTKAYGISLTGAADRARASAMNLAVTPEEIDAAMKAVKDLEDARTAMRLTIQKNQLREVLDNEKEAEEEARREAEKAARARARGELKEDEALAKARYDQFVAHLDDEDKALKEVAKARREQRKKEQEEAEKDAEKSAKALVRFYRKEMRDEEREQKKAQKEQQKAVELHNKRFDELYTASIYDQMAMRTLATDTEINELDRLSRHEFDVLKARHDAYSDFYQMMGSTLTASIGWVAGATDNLVEDWVTGQEKMFERFASSVMKQAGQSLIGSGTKLAGEAIVSLFTPGLQPLAAAQGAAAAGLIGTGIGLGGVATGIMHVAGGGALFKSMPDKASERDRGASPRSSSDSSSGGPLVVNISYGVGGPLPEDTAREVRKVLDVDSRR